MSIKKEALSMYKPGLYEGVRYLRFQGSVELFFPAGLDIEVVRPDLAVIRRSGEENPGTEMHECQTGNNDQSGYKTAYCAGGIDQILSVPASKLRLALDRAKAGVECCGCSGAGDAADILEEILTPAGKFINSCHAEGLLKEAAEYAPAAAIFPNNSLNGILIRIRKFIQGQ